MLRAAKDLGRVLALARLSSREETEVWVEMWEEALKARFPEEHQTLARRAASGLRALLDDAGALDEARHAVNDGLLAGFDITRDKLTAIAEQLFVDALDPLAQRA